MLTIPTKPVNEQWTNEQWKAIYATGQDTLVSAAAGSGKTAVLINRMIQKVIAEGGNGIDVDRLLVVTFTNASAAEMRHRMAEALEKEISKNPTSNHLRRQLSLLNKAQISTLHSFCLSIVKQYAYLLDIDPGFRIANDAEAALLRDDVLAEVLENAYDSEDDDKVQAVYRLVDSFTSDRDDQAIETLIDKLYEMSRVHAEPMKWLRNLPKQYELKAETTIEDLEFIAPLKASIQHSLQEAYALIQEVRQLALKPDGPAAYGETAELDFKLLQEVIRLIGSGTWEDLYHYFSKITWDRMKPVKKDSCDPVLQERAKKRREDAKKIVTSIKDSFFIRKPARLLEEIRLMAPIIETLVELTEDFSVRYKIAKIERGLVDFSDLEHYALEILTEDDTLRPSSIALDFQERFKEVLVDEYQDTNLLQETILQLVKSGSEADGNLFMVGDVKQSIYRFRLAEPMLFLNKYLSFTENPTSTGMRIDLNANFRSRQEVLNGTNYVFEQIMGETVGEIDYDDKAALNPGATYSEQSIPIELAVLYTPEGEETEPVVQERVSTEDEGNASVLDEEEMKKSQLEARYIIERIQRLLAEGATVYDTKTKSERPLAYRDIVVLMRSMTWSADLVEEFKSAGIPLYAESSKGYFEAIEVMIMLNTLKIVDNPYQDIPLASVLRAPFVGMTENELAKIRLADQKAPFYDALKQFIRNEGTGLTSETADKLQRFLLQFESWRDLSRRGSLADLIWQIYMDTHYYEMVGAMPGGKQRQANLRTLHDRALMYEKTSFRGLFRFLRFIDRMRSRGDDLGVAKAIGEQDDVVRLMTIHSSKGLEFPVVFVAGLGRSFNQMDFNNPYLFDQDFGLAVKAIDPDNRIMYTSLPFLAMKEKKLLESKAEEMRVLYVAMTRAKERLILVGSVKAWEKTRANWIDAQLVGVEERLPEYLRARAKSYLDWIGPAVARHADFVDFTEQPYTPKPHQSKWLVQAISTDSLQSRAKQLVESEVLNVFETAQDDDMLTLLQKRFDTPYAFESSTKKRTKTSVSELKRMENLQRQEEPEYFTVPKASMTIATRPQFLQEKQMTAAEIGTAFHAVMQHIPQVGFTSKEDVAMFIHSLVEKQILTIEEGEVVKPDKVLAFFESSIGQTFRQAKQIFREMPFTVSVKDAEGDAQIVQGIVDCLLEDKEGNWILLDYKTDRIRPPFDREPALSKEILSRYSVQLKIYGEAIQSILNIKLSKKILYLVDINTEIFA